MEGMMFAAELLVQATVQRRAMGTRVRSRGGQERIGATEESDERRKWGLDG